MQSTLITATTELRRGAITQGVEEFCEENQCFWFVNVIFSYQTEKFKEEEEFQVWKFKKDKEGGGCRVICEDGNDNILIVQKIPFTDCKQIKFKFWFTNNTVLLPSEN